MCEVVFEQKTRSACTSMVESMTSKTYSRESKIASEREYVWLFVRVLFYLLILPHLPNLNLVDFLHSQMTI